MKNSYTQMAKEIVKSIKEQNYPIRSTSVTPVRIAQELYNNLNGIRPNLIVSYCLAYGEMKDEIAYVVKYLNPERFVLQPPLQGNLLDRALKEQSKNTENVIRKYLLQS